MNRLFQSIRLFATAAVLLTAAACSDGDDDSHIRLGGGSGGSGGNAASSTAVTKRLETPALKTGNQLISHWTKVDGDSVMTYCLEYDPAMKHSRWVAFRFDATTRQRNVSRSDEPWADDPNLSASNRVGTGNYHYPDNLSFDRGHLCASSDRLYSSAANEQTFYMSNISPQLSSFNQGYWITLEMHVQDLIKNKNFCDTLYVVKGGTIERGQLYQHNGADYYKTRTNGVRVAVPGYYYMALLKVRGSAYNAVGFLLEHKEYGYTNRNQAPLAVIAEKAMSIDELEDFTGIDFFPNLPDAVEKAVEASYTPSTWGL